MTKFGISQSVQRVEDQRFLTGTGRYVDDIAPENALHCLFFRAPVAHADITELDVTEARQAPGVHAVYVAADLDGKLRNSMPSIPVKNLDGSKGATPVRPVLATDRVRHLGEAIAMIVAETPQQAADASELILFDFEDLPVKTDVGVGGSDIHPEAPENLAYDWGFGDAEKTEEVFRSAAHHVSLQIDNNRIFVSSMEPRGCFAEWDNDRIHLCYNGQGVWGLKAQLASLMQLSADQIRVTNPDVGGSFGMKGFPYPEYVATAFAARELGRPVRWMSSRSEAMLSDNSGRDLTTHAEAAFDADHKLLAIRMNAVSNLGAYNSYFGQNIQSELALKVLPGVYDVQTGYFGVRGVYTNTTPVDAYRGAGRPEAIYVLERLMDHAARQLEVGQMELRRKNFIPEAAFPYVTLSGETYDVGAFDRVLDRAETEADLAGYAARKAASAATGKIRGLGLCYYIESILGAPQETTKIRFDDEGYANVSVGTQSNGQGHETVYAQILHDSIGWDFDKIRMVEGDSDLIPKGGGTGGSRSVTMQGNSIIETSAILIEKFKRLAEDELEVSQGDIVFEGGDFCIAGTDRKVGLPQLVEKAQDQDDQDLLETQHEFNLRARSYPNGAHFCEVEIDPQTGHTQVEKYTVVDDFGLLINPMLAAGQVHGGVVQGIGQAINEQVVYDADGQLLSGSFMDYGMPRADDVPDIPFHAELTPSTANDIGMKGCGEAGTVGALAAVMNAVQDAVWDRGIERVDMPVTPQRMWNWLQDGGQSPK